LNSPFDGWTTPFCFPDDRMGPDILFFLRKKVSWNDYLLVLAQTKFKSLTTQGTQENVLLPIAPEISYKGIRTKKLKHSSSITNLNDRWNRLFSRLFTKDVNKKTETRSTVHFLLQFLATQTTRPSGVISISELSDEDPLSENRITEDPKNVLSNFLT